MTAPRLRIVYPTLEDSHQLPTRDFLLPPSSRTPSGGACQQGFYVFYPNLTFFDGESGRHRGLWRWHGDQGPRTMPKGRLPPVLTRLTSPDFRSTTVSSS